MFVLFSLSPVFATPKYARVILVGDLYGGKTALWKRILGHGFDIAEASSDMMIRENVTKTINDKKIQFNVWDTAGANQYYDEVVEFTRNSDFVIIVHDISKKFDVSSENYINKLYRDVHSRIKPTGKILIVGSKYDKRHADIVNAGKQISMLESVSKAIPCAYVSCSAKVDSDPGTNAIIDFLFNRYYDSMELSSTDPDACMQKRFTIQKGKWCILI